MVDAPLFGTPVGSPLSDQLRSALAQQLIGAGSSEAPIRSWTQGANRAAEKILGGYITGKQLADEQTRRQAISDALIKATQPGADLAGTAKTLMANPETAPYGFQLSLSNLTHKTTPATPEQIAAAGYPKGTAGVVDVYGNINPTYSPKAGVDVPLPKDVEAQKLEIARAEAEAKRANLVPRFTWQPGVGPDPKDPTKNVAGSWRYPTNDMSQPPQFFAGVTSTRGASTTPANVALQKFMEENPDAKADDIARFIQKTRTFARSGSAMSVQKFIEENPDASSQQIVDFMAKSSGEVAGAKAWTGQGKNAMQMRSLNVAIDHLDSFAQTATALANGNTKALNSMRQWWLENTGSDIPTNFDAMKQIVAQETVKAIIAGGGGVGEREKASEIFSRANSPAQLAGAMQQIKRLMAGQLVGMRKQYEHDLPGRKDFEDMLTPQAKKELEGLSSSESGAPAPKAPSAAAGSKLVDQAREAIKAGRDPAAVRKMLQDKGIDPSVLDAQ